MDIVDKIMENDLAVGGSPNCIDDLALIENETFDFDLPVSPQECHHVPVIETVEEEKEEEGAGDDEDEVFIGPVGFKEKCVATNAEITIAEQKPMSPPSAEQFASLFKEAWALSLELQQNSSKSDSSSSASSSDSNSSGTKSDGGKSNCAAVLDSIQESLNHVEPPEREEKRDNCETRGIKSEVDRFRRQVKREIRSPARRNTYTIAVDQPSPYPTEKGESKLSKVTEQKRDAPSKICQPRPPQNAAPRGRGSMLPSRGLRRPAPVATVKSAATAPENDPKPNNEATNSEGNSHIPCNGLRKPAVKRLVIPKASGLKKPGFITSNKVTNNTSTDTKNEKGPIMKPPAKKMGLMKPSAIVRPGHRNGAGPAKPQPMKATTAFGPNAGAPTGPAGTGGATKKTTTPSQGPANTGKRKVPTPCAATPSTPVVQEKNVVPKRLLASGSTTPSKRIATPRRSSIACMPRPSTPVQPRTPQTRHTSISIPPSSTVPTSARRLSGIPTPNRRASTTTRPSSRLASTSSVTRPQSAQPVKTESARFSPLFLSPLQTPPQFQLSPDSPNEETKPTQAGDISALGSSPDFSAASVSKTPNPATVLRTRTNLQETVKDSNVMKAVTPKTNPSVGMLINFGSPTPKDKKTPLKPQQLDRAAVKENLIDF